MEDRLRNIIRVLQEGSFSKVPTTDVATVDGNSLGGQCPHAHVILVEAESS